MKERLKQLARARFKFNLDLNNKFNRKFWLFGLNRKAAREFRLKIFAAIKAHNLVETCIFLGGLCWQIKAYKVPSPAQLTEFDAVISEYFKEES